MFAQNALKVLILVAVSFGFSAKTAEKPKELLGKPFPKVRLALNWKPEPQFGGFYEAARNESFIKAPFQLEILPGGSGTPTVQMLAAGKVEYAIVSADELIIAHDRGSKDLVAVFASYQTNPQGLMVRAGEPNKTLKSYLQDTGYSLLWQSGLPYALYLSKKLGPVKAKIAPYSGGISYFQQDKKVIQQCFLTSEPLSAKKAGLETKVFLAADEGYNPYTTVLVTTKTRLKNNRAEVETIVRGVRSSWASYLKDPKATNVLMNKLNPAMDLATFAESAEAQTPLIRPQGDGSSELGMMTKERWQTLASQLLNLKLIKELPKTDTLFQNLY